MPRKRMIDPEFWSDEEIGTWSFEARLFYIGLWNFADDEGKFKANDVILKAHIFPYDTNVDLEEIKKFLGSKIVWYEVDKFKYGYIRNFLKYQRIDRPTKSVIPDPKEALDEHSTSTRRRLVPNISKDNTRDFDEFYSKYPKKQGKADAFKAFVKLSPNDELLGTILRAVEEWSKSEAWLKDDGKYIPLPATWLRGNRWEDVITSNGSSKPRKQVL